MAPTQHALYATLDLDLSWSERELPERERTKHVHRLHPYLGKFIPQLVEVLLARYFRPGQHVLDPFAGSGTTLVQALEGGLDATGVDIAAFNCLLMEVKTRRYDLFSLEREIRGACAELEAFVASEPEPGASAYLCDWYAPRALAELLFFRDLVDSCEHRDVLRIVLARAARSARRTAHFDLDFPHRPQLEPYWCFKHRRTCRPVEKASHFLRRYSLDTLRRIKEFQRLRNRARIARVVHADGRGVRLDGRFDGILTSPPYPGLIDYHEQHRYAYELLGLEDRRDLELGQASRGTSAAAIDDYRKGIVAVLENVAPQLARGAPVVIVVNDRRDLYPEILERSGLTLGERYRRHVNRRTGRRAGEFFEDVLVARARA
ncbi:MAG: DNA methyltransferase [Gaiellaceae bacterium]